MSPRKNAPSSSQGSALRSASLAPSSLQLRSTPNQRPTPDHAMPMAVVNQLSGRSFHASRSA